MNIINEFKNEIHKSFVYVINNKYISVQLIIIGLFYYILIDKIGLSYDKNIKYPKLTHDIHNYLLLCGIKTENKNVQSLIKNIRGKNYNPVWDETTNKSYAKSCITTNWNLFHFFSHIIITFLYPQVYPLLLLTTTLFEIYEYIEYDCHDYTDIIYNVVGIYIGLKLNKCIFFNTY
jgi:hypothetical protein